MTSIDVRRARRAFIQRLRANGVTLRKIAELAGVGLRSVSRCLAAEPRLAGRPEIDETRRIAAMREIARRTITQNGRTLPLHPNYRRICEVYNRENGTSISVSTTARICRKGGAKSLVRQWHPNLGKDEVRVPFARIWRRRPTYNLVFSDEHYISVNDHSSRRQIVFPGDELYPRERQRRQNVANFQIWAAIGIGWRSPLVFFPRSRATKERRSWALTKEKYVSMCLSRVRKHLCDNELIFMHDGASPHRGKNVLEYCERQGIALMKGFPASSPDLNPIESVWPELNSRIAELMPRTEAQLKVAAIAAWDSIPQSVINSHVRSFTSKCEAVVRAYKGP